MHRKGFTLLELLIVIGILAILATVAVLVINPAEYIKQSRDTKRIGDMDTVNKALSLYDFNNPGVISAQSPTVVHLSLPDTSATCGSYTLPDLPSGYTYACVIQANLVKNDGTGWIPVQLSTLPGGAPFATLPLDPTNDATHFYSYISGGSWALSASIESEKYLKQSALNDGGPDPAKYEVGSDLKLLYEEEGLIGYWPFDEGSGTVASDASGGNNNLSWSGTGVHYGAGKVGSYAAQFNGSDDYARVTGIGTFQRTNGEELSVAVWINPGRLGGSYQDIVENRSASTYNWMLYQHTTDGSAQLHGASQNKSTYIPSANTWVFIVATVDKNGLYNLYANGSLVQTVSGYQYNPGTPNELSIGNFGTFEYFQGKIDDARIYSRTLSATEVQAMYNATK